IQTASPPRFGRVLDLAGRLPIWRRAKGRPFVRRSSGTARLLKGARTMARSEEHTSELQSLMRISYAVFCLKNKNDESHTDKRLVIYMRVMKLTQLMLLA